MLWLVPIYILLSIATPMYHSDSPSSRVGSAKLSLKYAMEECAALAAKGRKTNQKFRHISGEYFGDAYTIIPEDRSCSGDSNGAILAISSDDQKYPNLSISMSPPHRKNCSHSGKSEELHGCSARRNGTW